MGLELCQFCVFNGGIIVCIDCFDLKYKLECMMTLLWLLLSLEIGLLILILNTDGLLLNSFITSAIAAELGEFDTFASDGMISLMVIIMALNCPKLLQHKILHNLINSNYQN